MKHVVVVGAPANNLKIFFTSSVYEANKGIYIGSIVEEDPEGIRGEPWADITVCIPEIPLEENEVIIPIYKLSGATYEAVKEHLIEEEVCDVRHGYAVSKLVRLKPNWKDLTVSLE